MCGYEPGDIIRQKLLKIVHIKYMCNFSDVVSGLLRIIDYLPFYQVVCKRYQLAIRGTTTPAQIFGITTLFIPAFIIIYLHRNGIST